MSGLVEQFYTAWVVTFANSPTKLVCAWHVDRAWRENIRHLSDYQLQVTVYHNLRLLLEELDKQKFELLLKQTLEQLKGQMTPETLLNTLKHIIIKKVGILLS